MEEKKMIDVHVVNKNKKKYINSYRRKKMIDVHAVNKKKKKVYRFLQQERKKMIDVHTVNQKKQRKYIDSYNMEEKND